MPQNAIVSFRVDLVDGHSFQLKRTYQYTDWGLQRGNLHLSLPPILYEGGGVWEGKKFHPWHRIALIEWVDTERVK